MLMIYRPDCFIALISSGIKRNFVRAIRNDGNGDSQRRRDEAAVTLQYILLKLPVVKQERNADSSKQSQDNDDAR